MTRPPDPDRFESPRLRIRKGTLACTRGLQADPEHVPLEPDEILAAEDVFDPADDTPDSRRTGPDRA